MSDPVISHCPYCGQPWPRERDGHFYCSGCNRFFSVDGPEGRHPEIKADPKAFMPETTKIILDVVPGSIPDAKPTKKKGIAAP